MIINIGADEIILWLRKNQKANSVTTQMLGIQIKKLILELNGSLVIYDQQCFWDTDPSLSSIDKFKLPMTASQYQIDSSKLEDLFIALSGW